MVLRSLYRLYWLWRVTWKIHLFLCNFSLAEVPLARHLPWRVLPRLVLDAYDLISEVLYPR